MRRLLLAATMLALPLTAHAGWYAGPALMVGMSATDNAEQTPANATTIQNGTDNGINVGAAALLGYDFAECDLPFSLEFSGNWHYRHDQNIGFFQGFQQGVKSDVQTTDFMASVLYDIPLGTTIQPYIGAGAGMVYANIDNTYLSAGTTDIGSSSDWNFAWQVQGGIKYPLDDSMKLRVDYRYIDMGEIETSAIPSGETFTSDMSSHDLRVGVTWDF